LKEYLTSRKAIIEESLTGFFDNLRSDEYIKAIGGVDRHTFLEGIVNPIRRSVIEGGGKRFRPVLTYLVDEVIRKGTGNPPYRHRDVLAIIPEVLHKGTCVVDDIQDKSDERNGLPAEHIRTGIPLAIGSGTGHYLLHRAILDHPEIFLTGNNGEKIIGEKIKASIGESLEQELLRAIYGQNSDVSWKENEWWKLTDPGQIPTKESYCKMAADKNAAVVLAMRIGGILGGASDEQMEDIKAIGNNISVAFQIRDDVLDMYKNHTGYGADIKEGSPSLPLIMALSPDSKLDEKTKTKIRKNIGNSRVGSRKLVDIVNSLEAGGILEDSQKVARDSAETACYVLDEFPEGDSRELLKALANYAANRDK